VVVVVVVVVVEVGNQAVDQLGCASIAARPPR